MLPHHSSNSVPFYGNNNSLLLNGNKTNEIVGGTMDNPNTTNNNVMNQQHHHHHSSSSSNTGIGGGTNNNNHNGFSSTPFNNNNNGGGNNNNNFSLLNPSLPSGTMLNSSSFSSLSSHSSPSPYSPTSPTSAAGNNSPFLRKDALSQVTWLEATVFVGRLPRRSDIQDIYQFFSGVGPIQAIIPSRDTYLFIEYTHPDAAHQATQILNGQLFRGSHIVVQPANTLTKLFIGNIHKTLDAKTIHDAIYSVEEGLISVELFEMSGAEAVLATMQNPQQVWNNNNHSYGSSSSGMESSIIYTKNSDFSNLPLSPPGTLLHRGFCFAEFANHAAAHRALVTLMNPNFSLTLPKASNEFSSPSSSSSSSTVTINELRVDWAEPLHEVSQEVMETVRILYVGNLPPNYNDASEDYLTYLFSSHTESGAGVERVKRIKNYAFVHFRSRAEAEQALNALQNYQIVGHAIKIQWSKPPPTTGRNNTNSNVPIMNNILRSNAFNHHHPQHNNNSNGMMGGSPYGYYGNNYNNNGPYTMNNVNNQQQRGGMIMTNNNSFMNNNNNSNSNNGMVGSSFPNMGIPSQRRPTNNHHNNGNVPLLMNNNNNNINTTNNGQLYQNRLQKALSAGIEAAASFSTNASFSMGNGGGGGGGGDYNNSNNNNNHQRSPPNNLGTTTNNGMNTNLSPERLAYERGLIDGLNTVQLVNNNGNGTSIDTGKLLPSPPSNSFMNSLSFPGGKGNDIPNNNKDSIIPTVLSSLVAGTVDDIPTIDTTNMNNNTLQVPLSDRSQDRLSSDDTIALATESFLFNPNSNNGNLPFLRSDRNSSTGSNSSPLSLGSSSSSNLLSSSNYNTMGGLENRKLSSALDTTLTNDSARTVRTSSSATALSTGSNKGSSLNNSNSLLVTSTRVTRISDPPVPGGSSTSTSSMGASSTVSSMNSTINSSTNYPLRIPAHPPINNNHVSPVYIGNTNNRSMNNNGFSPRSSVHVLNQSNDLRYSNNMFNGNNVSNTTNNNNLANNPRLQAQLHAQALGYGDINTLVYPNNGNNNNNGLPGTNNNGGNNFNDHNHNNNNRNMVNNSTGLVYPNNNDNGNVMGDRRRTGYNNNNNSNNFSMLNSSHLQQQQQQQSQQPSNGSIASNDFYSASSHSIGNGVNLWSTNTTSQTNIPSSNGNNPSTGASGAPPISSTTTTSSSSSSSGDSVATTSTSPSNDKYNDATVLNDITELNKLWPLSPL